MISKNKKSPAETHLYKTPTPTQRLSYHIIPLSISISLQIASKNLERESNRVREKGLRMEKLGPTPDAISTILACPDPSGSVERPDIVIQVLDLGPRGITYKWALSSPTNPI